MERYTREVIEAYKREILEGAVLVRLDEAASILDVHPSTIRRRVEEGLITPYIDEGDRKHQRFLASELQPYAREMRER